jgi:hypothetical protein
VKERALRPRITARVAKDAEVAKVRDRVDRVAFGG